MALHPGEQKRHFPEELPAEWGPIRRDLEENEDWYRDLFEHSQDLLCVHELEGRFLSVNPVSARLLGYSIEEILEKRLRDIIDPQFREQVDAYLREIERTGKSRGLMAVVTRSGERRIWEYHNTLHTEGVARPIVRGMAHDVTERVRAQKALRESEMRFRAVFERSPVGISLVDSRSGQYLQVNPKFCEITGRSEEELLRSDVESITHPDDIAQGSDYRRQLAEEKLTSFEMDKRYVRPDGSARWVRVLVVPMWGKGETHRLNMALVEDATERRQSEETLRESELRFRTVYERSPVGICLVDSRSGQILQVNPKCCEIAGRSEEELLGIDARSITHPDDVGQTSEYLQQLAEEKVASHETEKRYVRPDGSVRWARILAVPMWGKGETRRWHMGLVEDITERRQAEEAIATLVQVRADSSENFFHSMAGQLAKCLEANYTFIGELIEGEECKVRTIGVCDHGVIAENFTYDLAHTPSEAVMRQGAC